MECEDLYMDFKVELNQRSANGDPLIVRKFFGITIVGWADGDSVGDS